MNVKIGTEAVQFLSGNICFKFSVLCLFAAQIWIRCARDDFGRLDPDPH